MADIRVSQEVTEVSSAPTKILYVSQEVTEVASVPTKILYVFQIVIEVACRYYPAEPPRVQIMV